MKKTLTILLPVGILLGAGLLVSTLFAFRGAESAVKMKKDQGNRKELKWREGYRLKWSDFEARPDRFTSMDATTESGIVFSWSCDYRGFHLETYAMFDKAKSWVKKYEATDYLLAHEQAHFDITEIHARKLRKRFAEMSNPCRRGRNAIQQVAETIYKESAEMQNRYDHQTDHSKNRSAQQAWLKKIRSELERLKPWAE